MGIAAAGSAPAPDDGFPLTDVVRAILGRQGVRDDEQDPPGWVVRDHDVWCAVEPVGYRYPRQGWKLHVSTTALAAPHVLRRAARVLVRHGCAFKFAPTLARVLELGGAHTARGASGKFVTAYPLDDDHFRRVAAELHEATLGLPGPRILSDRPYAPGSLVHYRYGAFRGVTRRDDDGRIRHVIVSPTGVLVDDRRDPWFSPPPWAVPPVEAPAAPHDGDASGAVLLDGRFKVHEAIRHANRGGVYLATDTGTGATVVVKQARRHVASGLTGEDARDRLRHEAQVLADLAELGVTPRPVKLFRQAGDLFLAEEHIAGTTLAGWVHERLTRNDQDTLEPDWTVAIGMARRLTGLLDRVHAAGYVLRDFTASNVMVEPGGEVRLIDLEMAARPGDLVQAAFTPGYAAPEQIDGPPWGPAPGFAADRYALGALLFLLLTGANPPVSAYDVVDGRPRHPGAGPAEELIDLAAATNGAVRRLRPLLLGLLTDSPDARWRLHRVHAFLRAATPPATPPALPSSRDARTGPGDRAERVLRDGLAFVVAAMRPGEARLWPGEGDGDPLTVQHGAAGTLGVLARAHTLYGGLEDPLSRAAEWIRVRLTGDDRVLPGLYFGRSGVAWALYDAARALGDEDLAAVALTQARNLPSTWPNPDVCHGAAGAGLTHFHLWQATGEESFRERALACADGLATAVTRRDGGVYWPIPASLRSELAGATHYGFAHGTAGIATFLLAAGTAAGREDLLRLAIEAGMTLASLADRRDGAAWWPAGPHDQTPVAHWCSGSSGVGTFLLRLAAVTGEERFAGLAREAASAVYRNRWRAYPVACHGLAGDADFLLDLAESLGEPRYRDQAAELAACALARPTDQDGHLVVADAPGRTASAAYGTGLSGLLALLTRLRDGGPRLWLPTLPALATAPASQATSRRQVLATAPAADGEGAT
ncbi:serine/threonine protein kinase [Sphaerisporangium album]|uniref:non-specific serine/threonine protein kinase n=1 Tax=Sphaerisporangium album TaxID=509200 RepID=A0A367EWN2_9ACTN|nr:class IV lanthionine synthetase LanL [Sphaerisporangium album]RCG22421.1 serine/threonine protein kinase [Sphaerisporangium album]